MQITLQAESDGGKVNFFGKYSVKRLIFPTL